MMQIFYFRSGAAEVFVLLRCAALCNESIILVTSLQLYSYFFPQYG